MIEKITGSSYRDMLNSGVNNLDRHRDIVNDLNVFPVPDGDTGTNMVMTMKNGLFSLEGSEDDLSCVAKNFANATVFGARGNSGVIISQFFKGVSEGLHRSSEADCAILYTALEKGCEYAYAAVANPTEGTVLTVLKDATAAVKRELAELHTIDELVDVFLDAARISLDNTPELLPILKKAGVVDSGGSGMIYFFEGVQKYLRGEEVSGEDVESAAGEQGYVDYSAFDKNSSFEFGYCTELLLQLTVDEEEFSYERFTDHIKKMGDSIVASLEGDKVKLHVHTHYPEQVMAFCHRFGEFLSLKIENMSVQHTQNTVKYLRSANPSQGNFAIVAVAPNSQLQEMLADMGADVVIMSREVPSSKEFLEAFELIDNKYILVFPNSSNSILSAMQAGTLHKKAHVRVLNCRSIAQCYSSLAMMDFDSEDISEVVSAVNDTIGNIYEVSVIHASKNIHYGSRVIVKNDYFALSGEDILLTGDSFDSVSLETVRSVAEKRDVSVVTLFYGKNVTQEKAEHLAESITDMGLDIEACIIPTQSSIYDLVLSFE